MSTARTVTVAAIQVESHPGDPPANLSRATPFVAAAAAAGAELVVCPEFLATGYVYDDSIWDAAEPRGGLTETWLADRATEHGIYIGASYLEADGDDFYNTFTLVAPDGAVAGRVRKESLPAFEGWYFKSCGEPKVIDTDLGRIAVGICQDNHTARFMRRLCRDQPDLLLMPHSAPCLPFAADVMRESLEAAPQLYAETFGIPAVFVNKVQSPTRSPIPVAPFIKLPFRFPGLSSIVDSDARLLERLPDEPGIAVATVHLDPARKRAPKPPTTHYWANPPPRFARLTGAAFVLLERLAKRAYAKNPARKAAARTITHRASTPAPRAPHLRAV